MMTACDYQIALIVGYRLAATEMTIFTHGYFMFGKIEITKRTENS